MFAITEHSDPGDQTERAARRPTDSTGVDEPWPNRTTRTMTARAQSGARRGPLRGPGGAELPRGARSRTARGGAGSARPIPSRSASAAIDAEFGDVSAAPTAPAGPGADGPRRRSWRRWTTKVDLSALEADFVKTASKYAAAQGHLLRGVARARRRRPTCSRRRGSRGVRRAPPAPSDAGSSAASSDSQQHDAVGAAEQRVAGPLGVRHQADDVAALVADAGDVVEAAVGVVDVAHDDAVVGPELGAASRRRRCSCPRSG